MTAAGPPAPAGPARRLHPAVLFAAIAALAFVDAQLSVRFIDHTPKPTAYRIPLLLEGFARWDTGWYLTIAERGYAYRGPGVQSSVAFFPAYPLAMAAVGVLVPNLILAGVLVTLACGAGVAVLFHRWARAFLGRPAADLALGLLLSYPFAYYLLGAVYSDALFLVAALGAFSLLERDRFVLSGVVGLVATAARPVGFALLLGLALRALEIRGVLPGSRRPSLAPDPARQVDERRPVPLLPGEIDIRRLRTLRASDAGVLLAGLGIALYAAFLWARFGDPFAFVRVGDAPGWYRTIDGPTIAKVHLFRLLDTFGLNVVTLWLVLQGLFGILSLALVPATVRRFGWGYGAYVLVVVGIAFLSTREFIGMGRYVLAGFPAFATAADLVLTWSKRNAPGRPPGLRWALPPALLTVSACGLAWTVSLFARWYFLS